MKWYLMIMSFIVFVSCEKDYYYEFIVENNTSYNVRIEGYNRIDIPNIRNIDIGGTKEIIEVNAFSSYRVIKARGINDEPLGIFSTDQIDSINIVFNNSKVITQYCNEPFCRFSEIERNIMDIDNEYDRVKTGRSSGEDEYRFTYTITEEDYERATVLN